VAILRDIAFQKQMICLVFPSLSLESNFWSADVADSSWPHFPFSSVPSVCCALVSSPSWNFLGHLLHVLPEPQWKVLLPHSLSLRLH
jgi:hypothetical protein